MSTFEYESEFNSPALNRLLNKTPLTPIIEEFMKQADSMTRSERYDLPFFGHQPQDMGIPPSNIADRIEQHELAYAKWLGNGRWHRFIVQKLARVPCFLFRKQVHELARAYSQKLNDTHAAMQQQDDRRAANVTMGHVRQLRLFLAEHFSEDLAEADARQRPLIEQCQTIMLRLIHEIKCPSK